MEERDLMVGFPYASLDHRANVGSPETLFFWTNLSFMQHSIADKIRTR